MALSMQSKEHKVEDCLCTAKEKGNVMSTCSSAAAVTTRKILLIAPTSWRFKMHVSRALPLLIQQCKFIHSLCLGPRQQIFNLIHDVLFCFVFKYCCARNLEFRLSQDKYKMSWVHFRMSHGPKILTIKKESWNGIKMMRDAGNDVGKEQKSYNACLQQIITEMYDIRMGMADGWKIPKRQRLSAAELTPLKL